MAHLSRPKISFEDTLSTGSYGKVVLAGLGKQPCAAKLLHETMLVFDDPGQDNIGRKFKEECELMINIDHPNIVKYLGTNYVQEDPCLYRKSDRFWADRNAP